MEYVVAIIISAIAVPLSVVLIRFNLKRLHIIRCAKACDFQQLEAIYKLIDELGTLSPLCAILARINRTSGRETDWGVRVPPFVGPWAGRTILVDVDPEVLFRFSDEVILETVLRGQLYRVIRVPRSLTKGRKARNQFSPGGYVSANPRISDALAAVCAKYPVELLAYLIAVGHETFEFASSSQVRIGGSPSWIQYAEFPECEECRRRMAMVLQLPGSLLPGKPLAEGTFYFFACVTHPSKTKTVAQFA
jgi:hypothetical protein